jgi:group I intron endonuclease
MIGIYKITNPKGKIYIGQSVNIHQRHQNHKSYCGIGVKLKNSYEKYGFDNHQIEIIEECDVNLLMEREEYWIQYYNSIKNGLNSKLGGNSGHRNTDWKERHLEGLIKFWENNEGYWKDKKRENHSNWLKENGSGLDYERTQDHKDNLSVMMKEVWKNKREEIIQKIKTNKIGKKTKKVICNETKKVYNSIKECSEDTGISKGNICKYCKGTYPYSTIRGYTFSYI